MRLYLKILFSIALTLLSFGVVLPFLISFPSTILVSLGFVYAFVILPFVLYRINRNTVSQLMKVLK